LASVALTLLVEMPFNNIKSWLLDGNKKAQSKPLQLDVNANIKEKMF
jgi:hypothetical protein